MLQRDRIATHFKNGMARPELQVSMTVLARAPLRVVSLGLPSLRQGRVTKWTLLVAHQVARAEKMRNERGVAHVQQIL